MTTKKQAIMIAIKTIFNYQNHLKKSLKDLEDLQTADLDNLTDDEIEDLTLKIFSTGLESISTMNIITDQSIQIIKDIFDEASLEDIHMWN